MFTRAINEPYLHTQMLCTVTDIKHFQASLVACMCMCFYHSFTTMYTCTLIITMQDPELCCSENLANQTNHTKF